MVTWHIEQQCQNCSVKSDGKSKATNSLRSKIQIQTITRRGSVNLSGRLMRQERKPRPSRERGGSGSSSVASWLKRRVGRHMIHLLRTVAIREEIAKVRLEGAGSCLILMQSEGSWRAR